MPNKVVSFHVVPNGIRTSASLPRRATVPTRLGAGRDGSMTINKPRRTSIAGMDVRYRTIDADDDPSDPRRVENDDSDVEAADVTLSGAPYRAGADGHVVHVIEDVMVPVVAGPLLRLVRWNNRMVRAARALRPARGVWVCAAMDGGPCRRRRARAHLCSGTAACMLTSGGQAHGGARPCLVRASEWERALAQPAGASLQLKAEPALLIPESTSPSPDRTSSLLQGRHKLL